MLKLIEVDHGEIKLLKIGTLKAITEYLKNNEQLINWMLDDEPDMELPELNNIETVDELNYELKKIDLGWWTLRVE